MASSPLTPNSKIFPPASPLLGSWLPGPTAPGPTPICSYGTLIVSSQNIRDPSTSTWEWNQARLKRNIKSLAWGFPSEKRNKQNKRSSQEQSLRVSDSVRITASLPRVHVRCARFLQRDFPMFKWNRHSVASHSFGMWRVWMIIVAMEATFRRHFQSCLLSGGRKHSCAASLALRSMEFCLSASQPWVSNVAC